MIPLGKRYNLIGIDVDNKDDTVKKFDKILDKNDGVNTLKLRTMNSGYHYYFKVTKDQKEKLEELEFKSKNNALSGLNVDVKYTDQVIFGPSIVAGDEKLYQYRIVKAVKPATLPDYLFKELVNIKGESKPKKKEKSKETCFFCEEVTTNWEWEDVGDMDMPLCKVCLKKRRSNKSEHVKVVEEDEDEPVEDKIMRPFLQ
jgi:hypothetical protein